MATTIQVSEDLRDELKSRKLFSKESFEEIIWDLLEDSMELSEETLNEIEQSKKEFENGEFYTMEEVKKELSL